ncbi:serine carboxypeptidase-like 11 isoform X2 [Glycine soja]|uniref:Serine carboxypeptidase-like 19 n=2 Tax=Glycine subgen. Soja TaxID=1462606 RepID=I1JM17_SOYBN|nr:serine carboxypeptidase-like 11 isoform X2 [Glycine soja]RZC19469.1 Serine carboxypeptidase-like 19 isoform A [Glycine soja]|eukprot:XP_003520964.1 serine carboxypeptidase-like 11 isoform X2 [Glycine max]
MFCNFHIILLIALALLVQISSQLGSKVEVLPGFEGPLPFELETGYVGLGEKDDDMQVFYYFVKSENDPQKDPLMLWLTGGPGCSSFSGLAFQIGPLRFKIEEYDGSVPNLILRPQSWTKVCNIIFVDLPFGTGFSYAKNLTAQRSDWKLVHHTHQFLRKWLIDHPEFLSNEFYMGADSYSGIPAPAIVQEISNGNEKGLQPRINLQGYLLGNPITTRNEGNDQIPFAHGMGLISDELYASLQRNCKGEYENRDSRNVLCLRDLKHYDECLSGINTFYILDRYCKSDSPKKHEAQWRRSLTQKFEASLNSHLRVPDIRCQIFGFFLATQWANDESVRKSLHIREGTIGKWERCYTTDFEEQIFSSFEFHVNLSGKGYRSLIYSGDHDAVVPFMSTQAWIRALNYSIVEDWRPWLLEDQVAGYTRTYSNQMTFATVKGSGHTAPEYKPEEGFAMFSRWIANMPL